MNLTASFLFTHEYAVLSNCCSLKVSVTSTYWNSNEYWLIWDDLNKWKGNSTLKENLDISENIVLSSGLAPKGHLQACHANILPYFFFCLTVTMKTHFYYKTTALCKSFEPPLISLYFPGAVFYWNIYKNTGK